MLWQLFCVILVLCLAISSWGASGVTFSAPDLSHVHEDDRLGKFYKRIAEPDTKYCPDRTKLLPDCNKCIPGLQQSGSSGSCDQYIGPSKSIRDEIKKLVIERFGEMPTNRTFGLYPCKQNFNFIILLLKLILRLDVDRSWNQELLISPLHVRENAVCSPHYHIDWYRGVL